MDKKSQGLAEFFIKRYYSGAKSITPMHIDRREFGFGNFEKKIAYRHFKFNNDRDLQKYLAENGPPFVSYSSAEYQYPDRRPMENKGWKGTWLVFDLDATDLKLECQKQHGRGWVCSNCLSSVKTESLRLIEDYLIPDFGISKEELLINFSGNRGYHVTVMSDEIFSLDSKARREISEYIAGINIDLKTFFPTIGQRSTKLEGPKPTDKGWGGKFANGVITALNKGEEYLISLGVEPTLAKKLAKNRANIILGIVTGNWDRMEIPKKASFWTNLLKNIAIRQSDSIDKNVTSDMYHLIRLPDTIHGDTGLIAKKIRSVSELEKFEPLNEAIAFRSGTIKIKAEDVPEFTMNDKNFGPFKNSKTELPTYAAMYLIMKGKASLI